MTTTKCQACNGSGYVTKELKDRHGLTFHKNGLARCDKCDGTGRVA